MSNIISNSYLNKSELLNYDTSNQSKITYKETSPDKLQEEPIRKSLSKLQEIRFNRKAKLQKEISISTSSFKLPIINNGNMDNIIESKNEQLTKTPDQLKCLNSPSNFHKKILRKEKDMCLSNNENKKPKKTRNNNKGIEYWKSIVQTKFIPKLNISKRIENAISIYLTSKGKTFDFNFIKLNDIHF